MWTQRRLEDTRRDTHYVLHVPKLGALFVDLHGEFTCGGEDEDNGAVTGGEEGLTKIKRERVSHEAVPNPTGRLRVDVEHRWQCKRDGLPRAGLSDGDNIATRESNGPGLTLDRRGGLEPLLLDSLKNVIGETSFLKCSNWLGNPIALNLRV